jgi:hypothetical protein
VKESLCAALVYDQIFSGPVSLVYQTKPVMFVTPNARARAAALMLRSKDRDLG